MFSGKCEFGKCSNKSSRIASSSQLGVIDICDQCWNDNFRS
jgi:hypothetical protein